MELEKLGPTRGHAAIAMCRSFSGRGVTHMVGTAPDRLTLQDMKKGPDESYREYAVRWEGVAS